MMVKLSIERVRIWRVKGLMIGTRLSLTWLWLAFWLMGLPASHARAIHSVAGDQAGFFSRAVVQQDGSISHFGGVHYRSARRFSRRCDFPPGSNASPDSFPSFQDEARWRESFSQFHVNSQEALDLARNWQFRWRTALNARAPSFLS
jgi:hypothetical protein